MKTEITIPALCSSQNIATREAFHSALAQVNALVKREDISVMEAKAALTKADALRAWAAYDRRLSDEEKKEANRAMTRTIKMLAELADKEAPHIGNPNGGSGRAPGSVTWLVKELSVKKSTAAAMRKLCTTPHIYESAIDSGRHWMSVVAGTRQRASSILKTTAQYMLANGPNRLAMEVQNAHIARTLTMLRSIKAWCADYEAALIKRQAIARSEKGKAAHVSYGEVRRAKIRPMGQKDGRTLR